MNPGIKGEKFKIILNKQWDKEPIIKDKINMTKRHFTIALIFIGQTLFLNADRQGQVQFIGTDRCAYYVIVNKD